MPRSITSRCTATPQIIFPATDIAQILKVPKSDVEIAKGMKSREKTVMVHNLAKNRSPEEHIESIRNALITAMDN